MAADLSSTHFELFGLPQTFELDRKLLDSRFRELQRAAHPDRYASASDQERRISLQQTTRINEGYETLKDPLRRGRYLLELGGYEFSEEHHTINDPEFLVEQMELREALAEVRGSPDPLEKLGIIMERIAADFDVLVDELKDYLAPATTNNQDVAADTLLKMQFFRRLGDEAGELEAMLEDELD
ncbi:MAG: Fe-S protein assembly co-chaperone HscB [Gammaproteobacteria bacterium]|nr:MAG: Fe-S protein assembly co-chaperone HscB [Gammaproteobacteria bacterium]